MRTRNVAVYVGAAAVLQRSNRSLRWLRRNSQIGMLNTSALLPSSCYCQWQIRGRCDGSRHLSCCSFSFNMRVHRSRNEQIM